MYDSQIYDIYDGASHVLISFYDQVHGIVPKQELSSTEHILDPEDVFSTGQVVRCRVLGVDPKKEKLSLSFRIDAPHVQNLIRNIKTGSFVSARVTGESADGLKVELIEEKIAATIPLAHLSDFTSLSQRALKLYPKDTIIDRVLVVARDGKKNPTLSLSLKPSLIAAAEAGNSPETVMAVPKNTVLPGFVKKVVEFGVFVRLLHGIDILVPRAHLASRFVRDPTRLFSVGQTVFAKIAEVAKEVGGEEGKSKAIFTLCPTDSDELKQQFIESYFSALHQLNGNMPAGLASCRPGDISTITVESIKPFGLLGVLEGGVAGLVMKDQAKDIDAKPGSVLPCVILDIDAQKGLVDVSVRSDLVSAVQGRLGMGNIHSNKKKVKTPTKSVVTVATTIGSTVDATIELIKVSLVFSVGLVVLVDVIFVAFIFTFVYIIICNNKIIEMVL